jgi:glycerol-3-phosphate cytidylyltransferase-like family protein
MCGLLKGEGHPLLSQEERRYVVGSIKYVKQALITTGDGWVDADPEIKKLKPDIYVVNEDGDKGGKREYCASSASSISCSNARPRPACRSAAARICAGFKTTAALFRRRCRVFSMQPIFQIPSNP